MTTLATIGAGNIGTNVALAAIQAGYDVVLSNSRGPESLSAVIAELGPMARAATIDEAAAAGDIVLVAIPLASIGAIPAAPLAGKIVVDANNYYPQRDGRIASLDANETTTSEMLQAHLPDSHVVKAFNNIYAAQIPTDGGPKGAPGRRALPIAGNDADAKATVAALLDDFGYDAVDLGPLSESWRVERDTLAYGQETTADQLRDLAARTPRVQQVQRV
ncbi:NADPH-dependent F420 reductase [Demequina sp.]|uniref:NADPH-dependent F420 reductase n=1 Tax=Demequina sp. TaxID=2050685 RepID=UPI0025BE6AF1|nr:NADPH-dependent F420 reductase [Demequina sp.]